MLEISFMRSLVAPMNLTENEKGFEVPGLKPEDIEVTVQENTLTVKGHYQTSRAVKAGLQDTAVPPRSLFV